MKKSIKLRMVLKANRQISNLRILKHNLGDEYLYDNNWVFRNIRDSAIQYKIRFSTKDFCGYRALPLGALDELYERKTIVYADNVSPVRKIESNCPGLFSLHDLPDLARNPIVHETTHLCIKEKFPSIEDGENSRPSKKGIVAILLAESFATTFDTLFMLLADNEFHLALTWLNSFPPGQPDFQVIKDHSKILKKSFGSIGRKKSIQLLSLAFLYSNFLYQEVGRRDFQKAIDLTFQNSKIGQSDLAVLESIFKMGLSNQPRFVIKTASFYFRQRYRRQMNLFQLLNFDFLKILKNFDDIFECWCRASDLITKND